MDGKIKQLGHVVSDKYFDVGLHKYLYIEIVAITDTFENIHTRNELNLLLCFVGALKN